MRFETGEAFSYAMPPDGAAGGDASGGGDGAAAAAAVAEFVGWIEREKPGPAKSASDVSHAGEKSRQGTKRKLGVRR